MYSNLIFYEIIQKSVHLPLFDQSPYLVGSGPGYLFPNSLGNDFFNDFTSLSFNF